MIEDPQVLRIRYADYCSGRIARRFLELNPEEVWQRAQLGGATPPPDYSLPPVGTPSYLELAQRATDAIRAELGLPSFEEFVAVYRVDPERYAAELAGYAAPEASQPG